MAPVVVKPKKLLRCFCGCTEITEEEVHRIHRLSIQATLIDQVAVKLLRNFLKQRRSGDKSDAESFLDVYENCEEYLTQDNSGVITLDELDELCSLGLPFHMERDLKAVLQTGDRSNIKRCLLRIQCECRNEIEVSREYKEYKTAMLEKLKQ